MLSTLPEKVEESVIHVLEAWGFEEYSWIFTGLGALDTLPVIATLCNHSAKMLGYNFYDHKEVLVGYLVEHHEGVWADTEEGIVYVETPFGQFSYHVFEGEDIVADSSGFEPVVREWDGIRKQDVSYFFVREIIADIALEGMEARSFRRWDEQEVYESKGFDYYTREFVIRKYGVLGGTYSVYLKTKAFIEARALEIESMCVS